MWLGATTFPEVVPMQVRMTEILIIAQGTRNENNIIKSTFQASVYEDNRTYDKDTNTV